MCRRRTGVTGDRSLTSTCTAEHEQRDVVLGPDGQPVGQRVARHVRSQPVQASASRGRSDPAPSDEFRFVLPAVTRNDAVRRMIDVWHALPATPSRPRRLSRRAG